jgi:hypothetical protein
MTTALINGLLFSGIAIAVFVGTMAMLMGTATEK